MARVGVKVTGGGGSNPAHPSLHTVTPAAAEAGDVYLSYDDTKITGNAQLRSEVAAALGAIINGKFSANS
jgi:hypothetical protein